MLDELREDLSRFNTADLLAKVGALHLVPGNASRAISLDALAHLIAAHADQPETQAISRNRLRRVLHRYLGNTSSPGMADDPAAQMFTEELLFSGGAYVVFPGPSASEQDVLRWLLKGAVLRKPSLGSKEFRDEVARAAILCLSVSDRIAWKAGIKRGEIPHGYKNDEIIIPDLAQLTGGMNAVTFSRGELVQITHGEEFFATSIDPVSVSLGAVNWETYSFEFGQLHHTPFVKAGDRYIVPVPSLLLVALRHRILCIARSHGVLAELAESYRGAIWTEVEELLGYLHSLRIPIMLPDRTPVNIVEGLFTLDSDKALYVQLSTDSLNDFAGGYEPSRWETQGLVEELTNRATEIVEYLGAQRPGPDRVLILTILQPIGRAFVAGFGTPPEDSLWLIMSASDLRTIILVEARDPLVLWKYARAHDRIRQAARIIATDALDEYEMYRARQHSYYFSDGRRPNLIAIVPGSGLEMRKKVSEQLDPHGVPSFHAGRLVEVWSLSGSSIPICSPPSQLGRQLALVVEGELPLPVWVIGEDGLDGRLREVMAHIIDALAYWLWQFQSLLAPALMVVAKDYAAFVIEIDIDDPIQWIRVLGGSVAEHAESGSVISLTERIDTGVRITWGLPLLTKLQGADNRGERELVHSCLAHLRDSLRPDYPEMEMLLSDMKIREAVDDVAGLGTKKKLTILPLDRRPELNPTNLPKFRPVQVTDFAELLDGAGQHIRAKGWREGEIPKESRNVVLNEVVEFLYRKLEGLVATLNSTELLPTLIAYDEASTREVFLRRFAVPTRIAVVSQHRGLVENLMKELPAADEADLANRFLIEYVAARPPSGGRRLSLEIYDQLMALALEIINWGMLGDFIHFGLVDVNISVLPSGRLGYDHERIVAVRNSFMSSYFSGFLSEAERTFASHWDTLAEPGASADLPPEDNELDQAFAGEFGLTLTEITSLVAGIYNIGAELEGPAKEFRTGELHTELSRSLGWQTEKVKVGMDLLALGPRTDFLKPPAANGQEVYPWRFNRAWSYLRRPLVCTGYDAGSATLWGNRHLTHAVRYLVHLCLGGQFKAKSPWLRRVIGRRRKQEARAFEESVADIIAATTGVPAKVRLKKVGKRRIILEGQELGDIDVLAAIVGVRVLLSIECKDLALARTPTEIRHQLDELVYGSAGKPSAIKKHLARTQWIESHLDEVLMECFGIRRETEWNVKPALVSDSELYAPHITMIPFPVWSIETLRKMSVEDLAGKRAHHWQ